MVTRVLSPGQLNLGDDGGAQGPQIAGLRVEVGNPCVAFSNDQYVLQHVVHAFDGLPDFIEVGDAVLRSEAIAVVPENVRRGQYHRQRCAELMGSHSNKSRLELYQLQLFGQSVGNL